MCNSLSFFIFLVSYKQNVRCEEDELIGPVEQKVEKCAVSEAVRVLTSWSWYQWHSSLYVRKPVYSIVC